MLVAFGPLTVLTTPHSSTVANLLPSPQFCYCLSDLRLSATRSTELAVLYGVPQGLVLEPILFLL